MPLKPEFKRALLALDLDAPYRDVIEVAARLAELLKLTLVGLFALDDTLQQLAAYPGAREFVRAGGTWRQIDFDRMVHEQMLAAQAANRVLRELTGASTVPTRFEIVTGPATQAFVSMSCAFDILVVAEPTRASACATRSFSLLLDAAMRSPASVLLVPRSIRRRKGPIVAIAGAPDDPGVAAASAIAEAAHEKLVVIEAYQRAGPAAGAVPEGRRPAGRALTDARHVEALLANGNESLIVITRDSLAATDDVGLIIAEQRRVPVLILEPSGTAP
jgi:hypothetical protein